MLALSAVLTGVEGAADSARSCHTDGDADTHAIHDQHFEHPHPGGTDTDTDTDHEHVCHCGMHVPPLTFGMKAARPVPLHDRFGFDPSLHDRRGGPPPLPPPIA